MFSSRRGTRSGSVVHSDEQTETILASLKKSLAFHSGASISSSTSSSTALSAVRSPGGGGGGISAAISRSRPTTIAPPPALIKAPSADKGGVTTLPSATRGIREGNTGGKDRSQSPTRPNLLALPSIPGAHQEVAPGSLIKIAKRGPDASSPLKPWVRNPDDDIPLTKEAAIERRLHIVQEAALKPSANFSALPSTIHRAAATGQLNAVITYIKQLGCTPNEYDASGIGPIHYAAEKGFINVIEGLRRKFKLPIDAPTRQGKTAMMYAAKDGRLDVMNYLYDHGAKVTAQDVAGMTPAHFAVQTNQAEALVLLMELHLKDLAKRREYIDSLTKMAENAASATALSAKTTLEAIQKQPAVAENIVLDISSMNRTTPLHIAAGMDAREAVAVLLDYGVRINATDAMGDTPLHKAAAKNHVDMFKYLISRGADETITNMAKETPRDVLKDIGRW